MVYDMNHVHVHDAEMKVAAEQTPATNGKIINTLNKNGAPKELKYKEYKHTDKNKKNHKNE